MPRAEAEGTAIVPHRRCARRVDKIPFSIGPRIPRNFAFWVLEGGSGRNLIQSSTGINNSPSIAPFSRDPHRFARNRFEYLAARRLP